MRADKTDRGNKRPVVRFAEKVNHLSGVVLIRQRIAVLSIAKLPGPTTGEQGPLVLRSVLFQILDRSKPVMPATFFAKFFRHPRRQYTIALVLRISIIRNRPEIRQSSIPRKSIVVFIYGQHFVAVVIDFAGGIIAVTIANKQFEQRNRLFNHWIAMPAVFLLIRAVISGRQRTKAAPHAGARRAAKRNIRRRIGKTNPALHQAINVRGLRLRVPAHALNRVIQVVADNRQDIQSA